MDRETFRACTYCDWKDKIRLVFPLGPLICSLLLHGVRPTCCSAAVSHVTDIYILWILLQTSRQAQGRVVITYLQMSWKRFIMWTLSFGIIQYKLHNQSQEHVQEKTSFCTFWILKLWFVIPFNKSVQMVYLMDLFTMTMTIVRFDNLSFHPSLCLLMIWWVVKTKSVWNQ